MVPGVAIWADFEIFKILGGAGDIHNSTSTPNYCDEPYGDLGMYVNKLRSTWTEVLTDSGPPSASTCIMASGGRDLGDFRVSGRGW